MHLLVLFGTIDYVVEDDVAHLALLGRGTNHRHCGWFEKASYSFHRYSPPSPEYCVC